MNRALLVCDAPKAAIFYQEFLQSYGVDYIIHVTNASGAKMRISQDEYDVCVVHFPIKNDRGVKTLLDIADANVCQVVAFVLQEQLTEIMDILDGAGIIILGRPISKGLFRSALMMTDAVAVRLEKAQTQIARLEKRLSDEKLTARAKGLLIEKRGMSENDAHRYIEKQAMNQRIGRSEVAEEIIDFYEGTIQGSEA